jgi:hypothetical protein
MKLVRVSRQGRFADGVVEGDQVRIIGGWRDDAFGTFEISRSSPDNVRKAATDGQAAASPMCSWNSQSMRGTSSDFGVARLTPRTHPRRPSMEQPDSGTAKIAPALAINLSCICSRATFDARESISVQALPVDESNISAGARPRTNCTKVYRIVRRKSLIRHYAAVLSAGHIVPCRQSAQYCSSESLASDLI